MDINDREYMDCIRARETLIKIAVDLDKVYKEQSVKSKVRGKKKPTITHWHARGSESVAKWLLEKYPELIRISANPKLYDGLNTKIYSK